MLEDKVFETDKPLTKETLQELFPDAIIEFDPIWSTWNVESNTTSLELDLLDTSNPRYAYHLLYMGEPEYRERDWASILAATNGVKIPYPPPIAENVPVIDVAWYFPGRNPLSTWHRVVHRVFPDTYLAGMGETTPLPQGDELLSESLTEYGMRYIARYIGPVRLVEGPDLLDAMGRLYRSNYLACKLAADECSPATVLAFVAELASELSAFLAICQYYEATEQPRGVLTANGNEPARMWNPDAGFLGLPPHPVWAIWMNDEYQRLARKILARPDPTWDLAAAGGGVLLTTTPTPSAVPPNAWFPAEFSPRDIWLSSEGLKPARKRPRGTGSRLI